METKGHEQLHQNIQTKAVWDQSAIQEIISYNGFLGGQITWFSVF